MVLHFAYFVKTEITGAAEEKSYIYIYIYIYNYMNAFTVFLIDYAFYNISHVERNSKSYEGEALLIMKKSLIRFAGKVT